MLLTIKLQSANTVEPYCYFPWFHQRVNTDGTAYPCCSWDSKSDDFKIHYKEFFHSDKMKSIREEMLVGKIPAGCSICKQNEEIGSFSQRSISKSFKLNLTPGELLNSPELISQEIDYSNICNVSCRMCSSSRSFKIGNIEKELGIAPSPLLQSNWELSVEDLNTIKMLRFLGGEPLLHQDKIIHELKRLKSIDRLKYLIISLNTNMMTEFNTVFVELLLECKYVIINASIDAYGDLNSYIRTGSNWNTVLNNFIFLDELCVNNKIIYIPTSTLSILNCNKFNYLYNFFDDVLSNMTVPTEPIHVREPEYDIRGLPLDLKEIISDKIDQHIINFPKWEPHFNSIKKTLNSSINDSHLENSSSLLEQFRKRNSAFDRRSKFTFEDVNKEMYDWLYKYLS